MSRNVIIKSATLILWVCLGFMLLIIALLVAMAIHWHLDRSFYDDFYLVNGFIAGLSSFNLTLSTDKTTGVSLGQLSSGVLLWQISRAIFLLLLAAYSTKTMISVFNSVKDLKTFYEENIRAFKKLVVAGGIATVIASFNFGTIDEVISWNFSIPFRPIIYTSICYVLSEVFKEGKKLQEESNSFV